MEVNYNEELVVFCNNCGSLHITEEGGHDFCNKCQSVDNVSTTTIDKWLDEKATD